MTPDGPLFYFAVIAALCNLIGALVALYLLVQAALDYHATIIILMDHHRTRVARHSLVSEGVRTIIQLLNLSTLAIALTIAPERFNAAINDVWPLAFWSSCVTVTVSALLLINSFEGLGMRSFVLEGLIMDPDPNDVQNLSVVEPKIRNVRRDNC